MTPTARRQAASIAAPIDLFAARTPEAPAFALPQRSVSYSELAELSRSAAKRLAAMGLDRGERIAILLPALDLDYLLLAIGAARLGAIVVPVSARYKTRELAHVLEDAQPSILVADEVFRELVQECAPAESCRMLVRDQGRGLPADDGEIGSAELHARELLVRPEDGVRIVYTSGTTANPKGCLHTHRALLAQGAAVAERLALSAEDSFWTPLPFFHVAGWSTMLAAQASGACFSHVGLFEPGLALKQITEQRCTVLFPGFETVWMAVLDHPRFAPADLASARLVINVGVPERMRLMQERLPGAPQVSNTGSTEACGFLAIGEPSDPLEARIATAGHELAGMEVRLVDPDSGRDVAAGEPGEMVFRGEWRIAEYFGDSDGTAAAIDAAGWFHSGDLVRRDAEGRLVFVSRIKDMLKVGGENVASAEIEDHLLTHPAIEVAHVVAAPDSRYGEVPAAFVQLRAGTELSTEELIEFCLDRIATFKVPRYMRTVEQWPMSGTKVRKVALRESIAEELAREGITEAPRLRARSAGAGR